MAMICVCGNHFVAEEELCHYEYPSDTCMVEESRHIVIRHAFVPAKPVCLATCPNCGPVSAVRCVKCDEVIEEERAK